MNLKEACFLEEKLWQRVVLRWQRNRTGDHFLPYTFIKRSFECWATSTKQLLNAGRGHQAPRKAGHFLQKEVGQNIKDKKRSKTVKDGDLYWGGSCEEGEVSKHQETLSPVGLWGVLGSQRATKPGGKAKNKKKTHRIPT